jgi:DNA repair protein RadD
LRVNSTGADYTVESIDIALTANSTLEKISFLFNKIENSIKHILIFVENVKLAHKLQDILGIQNCGLVKATTKKKEREEILSRFKNGDIKAIVNVGILTTGFDFPELDCIVMARPTMSLGLYYQIIGRCVRPHPQKEKAYVYDFVGNFEKFGKITDLVVEKRNGLWCIHNGKNILTNVSLSEIGDEINMISDSPIMNFGKYKGTPLDQIPNDYLLWIKENVDKNKYNGYVFDFIEKNLVTING